MIKTTGGFAVEIVGVRLLPTTVRGDVPGMRLVLRRVADEVIYNDWPLWGVVANGGRKEIDDAISKAPRVGGTAEE